MKKIFCLLLFLFGIINSLAFAQTSSKIDWAPYMQKVESKIKSNWKPSRNSKSYKIIVAFNVDKNRKVVSSKIAKSSSNVIFDSLALEAVESSQPFPSFPQGCNLESVPIEFTFDYNIIDKRKTAPDFKNNKYVKIIEETWNAQKKKLIK